MNSSPIYSNHNLTIPEASLKLLLGTLVNAALLFTGNAQPSFRTERLTRLSASDRTIDTHPLAIDSQIFRRQFDDRKLKLHAQPLYLPSNDNFNSVNQKYGVDDSEPVLSPVYGGTNVADKNPYNQVPAQPSYTIGPAVAPGYGSVAIVNQGFGINNPAQEYYDMGSYQSVPVGAYGNSNGYEYGRSGTGYRPSGGQPCTIGTMCCQCHPGQLGGYDRRGALTYSSNHYYGGWNTGSGDSPYSGTRQNRGYHAIRRSDSSQSSQRQQQQIPFPPLEQLENSSSRPVEMQSRNEKSLDIEGAALDEPLPLEFVEAVKAELVEARSDRSSSLTKISNESDVTKPLLSTSSKTHKPDDDRIAKMMERYHRMGSIWEYYFDKLRSQSQGTIDDENQNHNSASSQSIEDSRLAVHDRKYSKGSQVPRIANSFDDQKAVFFGVYSQVEKK